MNRSFLFIVTLTGLLLILSCNDSNAVQVFEREVGGVQGTVFDVASGQPVEGARILIESIPFLNDTTGSGIIKRITVTDADGNFERTDVPIGAVGVVARKDGYRTPDTQIWALSPNGIGTFSFELVPGEDPVGKFDNDDQVAWPPDYQPPGSGDDGGGNRP